MLPHVSLGASQLLKPASTTPRSYGRRHRSWHHGHVHATHNERRREQRPVHHHQVHAWRLGHWPVHHDQAPATHNERYRGKRPGRNDEVPATHKTSAAANNGLSTTTIPPCSTAASFEDELRAPHRGTSLGSFVCEARVCSLC